MTNINAIRVLAVCGLLISGCLHAAPALADINREAVVNRFNPLLRSADPQSPFSVGNGRFTFTADFTGLQSFYDWYSREGIPLETKARWAWHSRANPKGFTLAQASKNYPAYGRRVPFATEMDTPAGQWLRKNPHDLPLAQTGFSLDGKPLQHQFSNVNQTLNLWRGELHSEFHLNGEPVRVVTIASQQSDTLLVSVASKLLRHERLAVDFRFPRGYDLAVKNTPAIHFNELSEHQTRLVESGDYFRLYERRVDDSKHFVRVSWQGEAHLKTVGPHHLRLFSAGEQSRLQFAVQFSRAMPNKKISDFDTEMARNREHWQQFWKSGAFIDFTGSQDTRAPELQRRILLSRYLMAIQSRATLPAQETGLTNSSWYGKHHTEMVWWHTAHWIFWQQPEQAVRVLRWFDSQRPSARALAAQRGLSGARWAKMVGPQNRESPGGNPLIIWNQPQPIHLAELLFQHTNDKKWLREFAGLVDETAQAMADMLVWQEAQQRYSLLPPIWIAQEIYEPTQTVNPTFELAYWRYGLSVASEWRKRLGKAVPEAWQHRLSHLAPLPVKDSKYVAIESIPDTFENIASRKDHPSMLAAYGLLADPTVEPATMRATFDAVLQSWDWQEKIWGWDYPMIAMTAARLQQPESAIDILLAKLTHNIYLPNGHVPQAGSGLRVYLPANGALLAAVAMLASGWSGAPNGPLPGFPKNKNWQIKAEGFRRF